MAVGLVSSTTFNSTPSGSSTLTITKPTGLANGDVLLAVITCDGTAPTAPSNWVQFGGGVHPSASWNNRLYYKIVTNAGSEPASYSWTTGTSGPSAGCMNAWRGVDVSGGTPNPIAGIQEESGTTASEPNTGPSVTLSAPSGRLMYVRAVRESDESASDPAYVASDLTTAVSGVSRRSSVGNVSTSGNTAYTTSLFSNDSNYGGAGTYPGIAISCNRSDDQNYEATFAWKAIADPSTGPIAATTPKVSATFTGSRVMPDGPIDAELPSITADFVGTAAPPEGFIDATLPKLSAAFEASGVGGPFAGTLGSVTSEWTGGVESVGGFTGLLGLVSASFTMETQPFGENVIAVEAEKRAFRITQDAMTPIYHSQVTQQ